MINFYSENGLKTIKEITEILYNILTISDYDENEIKDLKERETEPTKLLSMILNSWCEDLVLFDYGLTADDLISLTINEDDTLQDALEIASRWYDSFTYYKENESLHKMFEVKNFTAKVYRNDNSIITCDNISGITSNKNNVIVNKGYLNNGNYIASLDNIKKIELYKR